MIKNCLVTDEDINKAIHFFGPGMVALKVNTIKQTPNTVQDDNIEIPPDIREINKYIIFCFYIMYVNGMTFMNGIENTIKYRSTEPLSNMHTNKLYQG